MTVERNDKMERKYQHSLIQMKAINLELHNPNMVSFFEDAIQKQSRLYIALAVCAFLMGLFLIFLPPLAFGAWICSAVLSWSVVKGKKQASYSSARFQEDQIKGAFN